MINFFRSNSTKKCGVVIQGPLLSHGKVGSAANKAFDSLDEDDVTDYDCIENIIRLEELLADFGEVVITTWNTEPERLRKELQRSVSSAKILTLDDNTKHLKAKEGLLPRNNKYRQFLSSIAGLQALSQKGCSYAIKLRTDQLLDVRALYQDFITVKKKRKIHLMVPFAEKRFPDALADFYFVGKTQEMLSLFSEYINSEELHDGVHKDIYYSFSKTIDSTFKSRKWKRSKSCREEHLWRWNNVYSPASRRVYDSIVWRGESISSPRGPEHDNRQLFLDDSAKRSFKLDDFDWSKACPQQKTLSLDTGK